MNGGHTRTRIYNSPATFPLLHIGIKSIKCYP